VYNPDNSQARIEIETLSESRESRETPEPDAEPAPIATGVRPWDAAANQLLREAALLCIAHGVDPDTFMSGAWSAYVASRPGMRDQLEEQQLREHMDELRKQGRLPTA
jgi:hypothetical protein